MNLGSSQFESTPTFISSQTADPSPSAAKSWDANPMLPVTVKQIAEAKPSPAENLNFLIDGISVINVKLVGMAFDKVPQKTSATFVVDDGTGRISCIKWINDTVDTEEVEELSDGVYVRVHGHLTINQGKKQVKVYAIRPVTDYNEITCHFIECAHAHKCNTKLQNNAAATLASSTAGTATLASSTVGFATATTPIIGHQAVSSSHISQDHNMDGLGDIHKMVLDYLQRPSSPSSEKDEKGIHQDELAKKLKLSPKKIKEAMVHLTEEGMVYTTIDGDHFKSIDS